MAEIHKSTTVAEPVETVFEIVDDPANFPKYVPNVHEVVDVHRSSGRIGDSFRVIYREGGPRSRSTSTTSWPAGRWARRWTA